MLSTYSKMKLVLCNPFVYDILSCFAFPEHKIFPPNGSNVNRRWTFPGESPVKASLPEAMQQVFLRSVWELSLLSGREVNAVVDRLLSTLRLLLVAFCLRVIFLAQSFSWDVVSKASHSHARGFLGVVFGRPCSCRPKFERRWNLHEDSGAPRFFQWTDAGFF